jgi:transposase
MEITVGIDVSKASLDVHVHPIGESFRACCRIGASAIGIPLRLAVSRLTALGLRDSVCVRFH